MKTNREYSLSVHYKQGDDFRHFLDEEKDDVPAALKSWAAHFGQIQSHLLRLAQHMTGFDVTANAGTHHISFEPGNEDASKLLEVLVKEELLDSYDFEDEELDEDNDTPATE